MRKQLAAIVFTALLCAPLLALEPGRASGFMKHNDRKVERFAYSAARLQRQPFEETGTEIEVIVSENPVTSEDLADDRIQDAVGHLSVTFRDGQPYSYALHFGASEISGPRGLKFEGTANDKVVSGHIFSDGVISMFEDKDKVQFDVKVNAPVVNIIEAPATAAEKAAAAKSDVVKVYRSYRAAADDAIRPFLSAELAKLFDSYGGSAYMIRSTLDDGVSPVPLRVTVTGDKALLLVETKDQTGRVRFVREGGAWKVSRELWHMK